MTQLDLFTDSDAPPDMSLGDMPAPNRNADGNRLAQITAQREAGLINDRQYLNILARDFGLAFAIEIETPDGNITQIPLHENPKEHT